MSLTHRRLIHVPSEVDAVSLRSNLKLYSDEFIAQLTQIFKEAADGCYDTVQSSKGTIRLAHPVYVFQGKLYASYLGAENETGFVQDLETGEWLKRQKLTVRSVKENNAITQEEFDRLLQHGTEIGELVRQEQQHVQFFKPCEQKSKPAQKPISMLMLNPGMMIAQESAAKKAENKPEGDYVLLTKIVPGMTFAQFMAKRSSWPAALKLNMSIMMVTLVAEMQADMRTHVKLTVESIIVNLQKKLDKMIRLQGFGMCAAADEAVKQLQNTNSASRMRRLEAVEAQSNYFALGCFLKALWHEAVLPQELREYIDALTASLLAKQPLNLTKEALMLSEMKSLPFLSDAETIMPVYMLRVSECVELLAEGEERFNAFCKSISAEYVSVRLYESDEYNQHPSMLEILKLKQKLERANLVVSDKFYRGSIQDALSYIAAKNQRPAENGMRFVFSSVESLMVTQEMESAEEVEEVEAPADTRLLIDASAASATDEHASDFDDNEDDEDDESQDVFVAMVDAASEMGTRLVNCCLRVFRPNRRAQHSLDAANEGPVQLHTDTGWESVNRIV